jgi:hypothetical protein
MIFLLIKRWTISVKNTVMPGDFLLFAVFHGLKMLNPSRILFFLMDGSGKMCVNVLKKLLRRLYSRTLYLNYKSLSPRDNRPLTGNLLPGKYSKFNIPKAILLNVPEGTCQLYAKQSLNY